jgi:hypothetical protein
MRAEAREAFDRLPERIRRLARPSLLIRTTTVDQKPASTRAVMPHH